MYKVYFILVFLLVNISECFSQCSEKTKQYVDSIKMLMPYPKYNIDDTVYVAFINNPDVDMRYIHESDIDVKRVQIVESCIINGHIWKSEGDVSGLFIDGHENMEWNYQYIDATIENPRYKDRSKNLLPEWRFATCPKDAIQRLKDSCKEE